jgi:hypothetical protein
MLPVISTQNTAARKEQLQQEAQLYKNNIDTQVTQLKTDATKIGTTTLIIGGVLASAYLLFRLFTSSDSKKTKKDEEAYSSLPVEKNTDSDKESWIVSSIKGYILSFLIAIAKDKLLEAISMMKETNATEEESTNQ